METLTPQQVRRACMVCDMLHCLAWIHNRCVSALLYTLL
nr:MAG TPA: hypothetical protein [Caudoviricetes sp.]